MVVIDAFVVMLLPVGSSPGSSFPIVAAKCSRSIADSCRAEFHRVSRKYGGAD